VTYGCGQRHWSGYVPDFAGHVPRWHVDRVVDGISMATAVSMARGDALVTT
jgi:hypothetical protein